MIILQFVFPQPATAQTTASALGQNYEYDFSINELTPNVDGDHLPVNDQKQTINSFYLTVTAYSSTPDQTSGDPFITASGERVGDGVMAYNFLPFGTRVRFPDQYGDKVFVVQDRMAAYKSEYVADIWMETREAALQWGAPIVRMEIL